VLLDFLEVGNATVMRLTRRNEGLKNGVMVAAANEVASLVRDPDRCLDPDRLCNLVGKVVEEEADILGFVDGDQPFALVNVAVMILVALQHNLDDVVDRHEVVEFAQVALHVASIVVAGPDTAPVAAEVRLSLYLAAGFVEWGEEQGN